MSWGVIQEQPKLFQVLKTNIKLYIQLIPSVAEELVKLNTPIGINLICEDISGKEYHFRQGIEVQKVQVKKNLASFKVLINPITKLKRESIYNPYLPLSPEARKAKPRFWLRIFWGNYPPLDTCKFYLFIRRDEQRHYERDASIVDEQNSSQGDSLDTHSADTEGTAPQSDEDLEEIQSEPPVFASIENQGAFKRYLGDDRDKDLGCIVLKNGLKESKPVVFRPIIITDEVIAFLRKHEVKRMKLKKDEKIRFLTLDLKPDPVQICTQVLKPHISLKIDKSKQLSCLYDGIIDIELIWSYKLGDEWETIVVPNGVYYETSKTFTMDSETVKFKHVHVNSWTTIKNFVREKIPKELWKDQILKHNYGLRFNVRSNVPISSYVGNLEVPKLFRIDIRRENDPNYVAKGKRQMKDVAEPKKAKRQMLDKENKEVYI